MIQGMETTTLTINGDLLAALVKALRENTLAADCRALNVVRQVVEEHDIDLGDE